MSTDEQGVDLSMWQGRVDLDEARHQIGFAMVKASQGTDEIDPDYARDIAQLREMGEHRGSYHYPNAGSPQGEAQHYVRSAGRRNGEMQALDFEGAVLDHEDPVRWAHDWLAEVARLTGNLPLIYMSRATTTRFDWRLVAVELGAGLWVASWGDAPPAGHLGAWRFAIMWQRDETGHVHGINGDVDQDVFYGDSGTWAHYANNRDETPPPHGPAPVPGKHRTPEEYEVKPGDNLGRIAHHHLTTEHHLVELNHERHPSLTWNRDLIQVGWRLIVP